MKPSKALRIQRAARAALREAGIEQVFQEVMRTSAAGAPGSVPVTSDKSTPGSRTSVASSLSRPKLASSFPHPQLMVCSSASTAPIGECVSIGRCTRTRSFSCEASALGFTR